MDQERWKLIRKVLEHDSTLYDSILVQGIMGQKLRAEWKKLYNGRSINRQLVDQYYVEHQKLYRKENNREVVYDTIVFDIIHQYHAKTRHREGYRKAHTQISQQYYNITVKMVRGYVKLLHRIIYKKYNTAHQQAVSTTTPDPATVATSPVDDNTGARKINNNNNNNNNNNQYPHHH